MKKKIGKLSNYSKIVLTIIHAVQVRITQWEVSNTRFLQKIIPEPFELFDIP